jgi:cold shock protein
LVYLRT